MPFVLEQAQQRGDEAAFQAWYKGHAEELGLNPDPDAPEHFYDYRAAYQAGAGPNKTGHWPSRFKTEGHPRRFILEPDIDRLQERFNAIYAGDPKGKQAQEEKLLDAAIASWTFGIPSDQAYDMEEEIKCQLATMSGRAPGEDGTRFAKLTLSEKIKNLPNAAMQGLAMVPANTLKSMSIGAKDWEEKTRKALGYPPLFPEDHDVQELLMYRTGESIGKWAQEAFPTDPSLQEDFVFQMLPHGAGQIVGFISTGIVGRIARVPQLISVMLTGAAVEAPAMYEEARAHGADEETAMAAARWGGVLGMTEAIPISRIFNRFDRSSGGQFKRLFIEAIKGGLEEMTQESFQTGGENLVAQQLYDNERGLFEGMVEAGGAGGILGFVMNSLAMSMGVRIRGKQIAAPKLEDFVQPEEGETMEEAVEKQLHPLLTNEELADIKAFHKQAKRQKFRDMMENYTHPDMANKTQEEIDQEWAEFEKKIGKEAVIEISPETQAMIDEKYALWESGIGEEPSNEIKEKSTWSKIGEIKDVKNVFWHGSSQEGLARLESGYGNLGEGIYLTRSPIEARYYAAGWAGGVNPADFADVTPEQIYQIEIKNIRKLYKVKPPIPSEETINSIKNSGYIGIETPDEIIIFNPESIQIKNTLTSYVHRYQKPPLQGQIGRAANAGEKGKAKPVVTPPKTTPPIPPTPALEEFKQTAEELLAGEEEQPRPTSEILTFIRKAGGINPALAQGKMERFTYKEAGTTRLANPQGLAPDAMREKLQEAGYLDEGSTVSDMYDLMDLELHRYTFGQVMSDMPIGEAMSGAEKLDIAIKKAERAIKKAEAAGLREGIKQEKARKKALEERKRMRSLINKDITRMAKRLRKIKPERMAPQYGEEVSALLEGIDLVRLNKPARIRLTRTREFLDKHPEAELPEYMLDKIARLEKTNLKDVTYEDIKDIYTAVMHLDHLDKTLREIKVGRKRFEYAQAVANAIGEMKPAKKVVEETVRFQKDKKNRTIKAVIDTFGIRHDHYDLIIESLAGANSTMDKVLYQGVKDGIIIELAYPQEAYAQFQEDLAAAGFTEDQKMLAHWLNEEVTVGKFTLTRGERMALFCHSRNADNRESLLSEGFGFKFSQTPNKIYQITEQELTEILESLTPDEIRFASSPVHNLFENQFIRLNEVFYKKNGYPLPKEDFYYPKEVMPLSRGEDFEKQEALERFRGQFMRIGVSKGMLEKRVRVRKPIYLNSITYDINKSVRRAGAYIGLELPLTNASRLLYDKDFRRELTDRYGEQTWKEIEKGLRDIAGDWTEYTVTEELFRKAKNNMATAILGISWAIPKQVLSHPLYSVYVKPRYLTAGMIDYVFHPKQLIERHKLYSPEFTERAEGGFSRDVADIFKATTERRIYGGRGAIKERIMSGIKLFDLNAVVPGMQGAALQVLDELAAGELSRETQIALEWDLEQIGKPLDELTPGEKMQLAYKFADYVTERTQPMFSPEHRSSLSRGTTLEQLFTMFGSFVNQALNLTRRSFREARRTGDGEAYAKFAKALFLIFVVNTLGVAGIDELRDRLYGRKRKKSLVGRILTSWAGYVFFLRDIAASAISKIEQGEFLGWDVEIPVQRIPELMVGVIKNGVDALAQDTEEKRTKAAHRFIDDTLTLLFMAKGLPYETPKRFIEAVVGKKKKEKVTWR